MDSNFRIDRDPFRFSLRGIAVAGSHTFIPAVADDGINRGWQARFNPSPESPDQRSPSDATRQIETLLARYFAHGCCEAA